MDEDHKIDPADDNEFDHPSAQSDYFMMEMDSPSQNAKLQ
jgi:hypothetical protein